ncbi:MAG: sulfotransferase domain-containing protein, partial [Chitinophagaceae bacterium]|nr:sulfotransferase domain-containing protein [Chitinophagaceae bacterium]
RGVAVSQFHFYRYHPMLGVSDALDMDSFIDLFLEGNLYFGDYFEHTSSWINARNDRLGNNQVLSIRYEDLVERKTETLQQLSAYLFPQHTLSDDAANHIVASTEFERMKQAIKENPQTFHFNPDKFFREGKSMGWRDSLTIAQQTRIAQHAQLRWANLGTLYNFSSL